MQPVSQLYEEILRSQNYYVETSLVVGDKGVLITEEAERILFGDNIAIIVSGGEVGAGYGDYQIVSMKTTKRVFKSNLPEVGCCPCGEIYIEMIQPLGYVPQRACIIPYVRLVSRDTGEWTEWLRKGIYYLDTRENTKNDDHLDILTMHGYDAMMFAEQPYGEYFKEVEFVVPFASWTKSSGEYIATVSCSDITSAKDVSIEYDGEDSIAYGKTVSYTVLSGAVRLSSASAPLPNLFGKLVLRNKNTLGFPATDIDVIYDIAAKMGVEVDQRSIPYINQGYMIEYPAEYTMREVLGYIGAMYGGNWIMNDVGELQFIALWDLPPETGLITDELGYRLSFAGTRILINGK